MIYNLDDINEINGAYLVKELDKAFKPWQSGEPDRGVPLVVSPKQKGIHEIEMRTIEAGYVFTIYFDEYSAQLVASDLDGNQVEVVCAGSIENGQDDFETEFSLACVKAIKAWW